jgi:DNA-binding FrmR family transcriptional regulator
MLNDENKRQLGTRLKRAEGQIAGVRRMVEEGHYCVDILVQLSAAQAALAQIGKLVLAQHMDTCVRDAFATGSELDRERKIAELMDIFTRYTRPGAR